MSSILSLDSLKSTSLKVPPTEANYPAGLLRLSRPPEIYLRGSWSLAPEQAIAVVGTRHPTRVGMALAAELAKRFGEAGFAVVSGLARGIDTAAHEAALRGGVATAAVLGSGMDKPYPASNRALLERITKAGAILSEYPPGTEPLRGHFPRRNRLIAALSCAVVVVEAGEGSGALHTAVYARRLGLPVLVPKGLSAGPEGAGLRELMQTGAFGFGSVEEAIARVRQGSISASKAITSARGSFEKPSTRPNPGGLGIPGPTWPEGWLKPLSRPEGATCEELWEWVQAKGSDADQGNEEGDFGARVSISTWRSRLLAWEMEGRLHRRRDGRYSLDAGRD